MKGSKLKKLKSRTKFTMVAIFNLEWYTVVALYLSSINVTVPSELTVAWFAAWTVELGLLFGIKIKEKGE